MQCDLLQALVTALDLPWEEASHALRHAQGDMSVAFKNELSAYHLSEKLLDELVWEYASHRWDAEKKTKFYAVRHSI